MRTLAVQDVVIARALQNGTLLVKPWVNRFGGTNWMICEGEELIEVCGSQAEADDKVATVAEALLG